MCSSDLSKSDSADTAPFQNFSGKDFDGNAVDQNLFSGNAVTVINFWFTGCKPCVAELSKLNELNDAIKSMGGEVIGINTETFDENEAAIKEAKKILESQGAAYRNLRNVCHFTDSFVSINDEFPFLKHAASPFFLRYRL